MIPDAQITLRFGEVCEALGYSTSTCRRLIANGTLPGPIDPTVSPKLRRWSRRLVEEYAGLVLDSDPVPPHGVPRRSS